MKIQNNLQNQIKLINQLNDKDKAAMMKVGIELYKKTGRDITDDLINEEDRKIKQMKKEARELKRRGI